MFAGSAVAALHRVTAAAVLSAIREYDELGQVAFLEKYGFRPAVRYTLIHDGRRYDSKAIVGAAHGYATGIPLRPAEFSGGAATVVKVLVGLGFEVEVGESAAGGGR